MPVAAVGEVEAARGGASPRSTGCSQWCSTLPGTLEIGWLPPIWPPVRTNRVDAVAQRRVRAREPEEGVVGDVAGPVAGPPQHRRERLVHVAQRRPARRVEQPGVVVPVAEREGAAPAQDRVARRHGGHRLGVGAGEAQPGEQQLVDVGRVDRAVVDGVRAQRVDDHQDQVGAAGTLGEREVLAQHRSGRRGRGGRQEATACGCPAHLSSAARVGAACELAARERPVMRGSKGLQGALQRGLGAVAVELAVVLGRRLRGRRFGLFGNQGSGLLRLRLSREPLRPPTRAARRPARGAPSRTRERAIRACARGVPELGRPWVDFLPGPPR